MHTLKKILRGISSQTLKVSLFLAAVSAATLAILGTPEPIKRALNDSGIYTKIVGSVIQSAQNQQAKERDNNQSVEASNINLADPAIQKVVQDALPPEFLEQSVNTVLDGAFAWLKGDTKTPQITIDLSSPKQKLATGIGEVAYAKAATKPVCNAAQLRTLDRNNIDIFTVECIPPGLDLRAEQAKLVAQINGGDELLKDTVITADNLRLGKDHPVFGEGANVPFYENKYVAKAPNAFKIFGLSAIIWGVLAVVAGAMLLLLHEDRRRALWVIARALLTTGVVLIIGIAVTTYLSSQVKATSENQNDLALLVPDIVQNIVGQFNKVLAVYGGIYVAAGAGTMLALHLTKPKQLQSTAKPSKPVQK